MLYGLKIFAGCDADGEIYGNGLSETEGESDVESRRGNCFFRFFHQGSEGEKRTERTHSQQLGKVKVEVPTDILHPELYRALSEWRTAKTREVNMPAYVIMQQKALMGIVNLLPDTPVALEAIPYFGAKGVEKYGLEILGIVRKYMKENKLERPEIFTSVSGGEDVREQKLDAQHHEDKKKQKEKKKDSKLVSYEMFCQGIR